MLLGLPRLSSMATTPSTSSPGATSAVGLGLGLSLYHPYHQHQQQAQHDLVHHHQAAAAAAAAHQQQQQQPFLTADQSSFYAAAVSCDGPEIPISYISLLYGVAYIEKARSNWILMCAHPTCCVGNHQLPVERYSKGPSKGIYIYTSQLGFERVKAQWVDLKYTR